MFTKTTALFCIVTSLAACSGPTDDKSVAPFTFRKSSGGKSDDATGLLSASDLARLDSSLSAAIAAADKQIATLEQQIATLTPQLTEEQTQVNNLVSQISQRQAVVQNNYNNTLRIGLLGALFGLPTVAAVSLVQAYQQDSILQQLNSQLAQAKAKQAEVQAQITTYTQQHDALQAQLTQLQTASGALKILLASGTPATYSAPKGISETSWSAVADERARVSTLSSILDNANQQVTLLQKMLSLLQATNSAVESAVATLQQLATDADAEAKSSTDLFNQLLKIALDDDPEAAAQDWLDNALAQKTRAALKSLGWPASAFVSYLMGDLDDSDLEQQLLADLSPGGASAAAAASITLTTNAIVYLKSANALVTFANGPAGANDWIGIYPKGVTPSQVVIPWAYADSGTTTAGATGVAAGKVSLNVSTVTGAFTVYYFGAKGPLAQTDISVQ